MVNMVNINAQRTFKIFINFIICCTFISTIHASIHASICYNEFYEPVSDCFLHPLKVGYYAGPTCGSLHTLTDADGRPNANFARLNHPATYQSGTGTKYIEYSAGRYLSIKFSKQVHVHGIAIQGSPDHLKSYLTSFELWYETTVNNLNVTKPATVVTEFYKESGVIKRFQGVMANTTKFNLANPFYADEVRIYPILFQEDKVFRVELYGCYLGKVDVLGIVAMNYNTTMTVTKVQSTTSTNNIYYLKVNEPDGTSALINTNQSVNYTFKSGGQGSVQLGLQYNTGWFQTDQTSFVVLGPILGLELLLDGSTANPFSQTEDTGVEFRLKTSLQPYQLKKYFFSFGDSTTCTYNYCRKKFARGIYNITATASNAYFQASLQRSVVACPNTGTAVSYVPAIHAGGIGVMYLGPTATHNISIQYFALWEVNYEVRLSGVRIQNDTFSTTGLTLTNVVLPQNLLAPSQPNLVFNYTDKCSPQTYSTTVFIDEKIAGLSWTIQQAFKDQLILQVPYFFKNHPITLCIDLQNGTSVQCQISVTRTLGSPDWYNAVKISDKSFAYNYTSTTPGDTNYLIGGKCWNRLNIPALNIIGSPIEVREIPEQMTNFSLALSKQIVSVNENFYLYLIFLKGNQMNCSISSTSAGISQTLTYNQLIAYQQSYSNSKKAYRLTISTSVFSLTHRIDVVCRNVWKELTDNVTFQAQVPVSGLSIVTSSFLCLDHTLVVTSTLSQGSPIYKSLYIDSVQKLFYYSLNVTAYNFSAAIEMYGSSGRKSIYVRAWNDVSSLTSSSTTVRIARTVSSLNVLQSFNLTSPQAKTVLPQYVMPANILVTFPAFVIPNADGYDYQWTINNAVTQTTTSTWTHIFPTPGQYTFKLTVDGCNNVVYQKNLTVVSPIEDFSVSFSPSPEVVVNKSVTIFITNAKQSECLELDFGDLSTPMMHCKNDTAPSDLDCFTVGSVCRVQHTYTTRGNFNITVTASNGLYEKKKEIMLVAKTCYVPILHVQGDGTDVTDVLANLTGHTIAKKKRSLPLFFNLSAVSLNCEFSNTYSVSWEVYAFNITLDPNKTAPWNYPPFIPSDSLFSASSNKHNLTIPCCQISYGTLSVAINVSMTGHPNALSFSSLKVLQVEITQTDMIAVLNEQNHRIFPYNRQVTFVGSQSSDPDKFANPLSYIWYCRDTVLESRDIFTIPSISSVDASYFNASEPVVGCFGKSVGRIDMGSSSSVLTFNSRNLQENHTMEFTLVVEDISSFGVRKSHVKTTIFVLTKETPYFELSCSENCARKMNPSEVFAMLTNCSGDACADGPTFKWSLTMNNESGSTQIPLQPLLYSKDTDKDLRMKPNALLPDTNYTLLLRAGGKASAYYKQTYSFTTNSAPSNGSCNIHPKEGVSLFTSLSVSCPGWTDTDVPLSYSADYVSDYLVTKLFNAPSSSFKLFFPKDIVNGYTNLTIRIRIWDSLSMFTEINFTINSNYSRCDEALYDPVSSCSNHPLRVGFYTYPECNSLHMLSDSSGYQYADYARLDHPANFLTESGTQFYEYIASTYLSINLAKQAHIHAIALQGSPNSLRYYLTKFELWYKTTLYNIDLNSPGTTIADYYKESGEVKRFQADMVTTTKFNLASPIYAEEVKIYPITSLIKNSFRVELYGCYLGRVLVSEPVGVNNVTRISLKKVQDVNSNGHEYYYKVYEQNRNVTLLTAAANESNEYIFKSHGRGRIELGIKHSGGWLMTDFTNFIVYGKILGLKMLMNGSSSSPYKSIESTAIKFQLWSSDQIYQIKRFAFSFGDSSNCSLNNCIKKYPRGLYRAVGTASNDFYQTNAHADIIACPDAFVNISFIPAIHLGGIGIEFLGPSVIHNFTVKLYALWETTFNVTFDGVNIQNGSFIGSGWTMRNISLPLGLVSPSQHNLVIIYTDACESRSYSRIVYVDTRITGLNSKLNQTFKDQFTHQVQYFFKNESLTLALNVNNGTTVKCLISITDPINSTANWYATDDTVINTFSYTKTFTSPGDSTIQVGGKCWNRLNMPDAVVSPINVDVNRIPDIIRNFTLHLEKISVKADEPFYLNLIFLTGDLISCNVTYNGSWITDTYNEDAFLSVQIPYSNNHKAYRLSIPPKTLTSELLLYVTCGNIWGSLHRNVTIQVTPVPMSNLSTSINNFACFGSSFTVASSLSSGAPVYKSLLIDNVKNIDYFDFNKTENSFVVMPAMITTPGCKTITVEAWNRVSSKQNVSKTIRIAMNVTGVTVSINFTLTSPQALARRPDLTLPANSLLRFNALVSPNVDGYLFNWLVDKTATQTKIPELYHNFPAAGQYSFKLTVDGCNNVVYQKNLTVVSPIEDFSVSFSPSPEVVVNKSATIFITNAKQSECLELDFGDLSTPMMHCKNYTALSYLNCFTIGSVCRVQHTYTRRGNFTVKVIASNGLYGRSKEIVLMAKDCYNPIFEIKGDGTNMAQLLAGGNLSAQLLKKPRSSSLFYNITLVNVNCEFSDKYMISWRVYSGGLNPNGTLKMWNDPSFLIQNNAFTFSKDNHTAFIPCCIVKYGLLSVSIKVSMTGHNNTVGFETEKVLSTNITETDLVAVLKEKNHKDIQYNTTLIVDGVDSYDPDRFSMDLNYTWYCRDVSQELRSIYMIPNIPLININVVSSNTSEFYNSTSNATKDSNHQSVTGCFGKPAGRFDVDVKSKSISFNSMYLQENRTIELTLEVTGRNPFGIRMTNTSRTVLVRTRQTPFFVIRCTENCASKVDQSAKFSLIVDCLGGACIRKTAVFKWKMFKHNGSGIYLVENLNRYLFSRDTHKDFHMKPNVLVEGLTYTLHLISTAPDGAYYERKYVLTVNIAPRNGSCIIDPKQGMAIFSNFNINCTGWIDTELPLLYEVAHLTDLLTTVVCRQAHSSCQTMLPVGENGNSSLRIRIRIYDSLYMFTELYYTVQVNSPSTTKSVVLSLLARIHNSPANLKTAQLIGAVSSVLNANQNKSRELLDISIRIRDASMILLSRMVNSSSDDVIAPLIAMLATVPREFTQSSGIIATNTIVTLTSNLVRNQSIVIFRDLVSRSKSLLAAMGMVMKSTSVNLDPNGNRNESNITENPLKWKTFDGRLVVINCSGSVESLVKTVFSRMSPVEDPVRILTLNLGMTLEKKSGDRIRNTSQHSIMNGIIVLPSLEDLRVKTTLIIESMMKVTTFNSFFWAPESYVINSSLVDYSLRSDSQSLSITETLKPIQIYVPRPNAVPLHYQHWLFQERKNEDRVNYHVLKVENDNSIHIEFKPLNYCSDYQIYIKYNIRPSKLNYDRNWTLPDLSSCNQTGLHDVIRANICSTYQDLVNSSLTNQYNGSSAIFNCTLKILLEAKIKEITSHCLNDPYRIFMSDAETRNGTYYFGLYEKQGPISTESSLPQLFNDSRKCQLADNANETSYYLRSYTSKCRYWTGDNVEHWKTRGCQVGKMTNYSTIHCKCNHLTSFASDFLIAPNPIDMDKVIQGFLNIGDNLSVLVSLSLLVAFYIYLVVVFRRVDKKDADKVGLVVIDDDHSKPYEYLIITVTGARTNAGTTANVFCSLNTATKIGQPRLLYDPEKVAFQRDQINAFKISFDEPIGQLTDMRIWHDNDGESPGWYLSRVYVEEIQTNKRYSFLCEQWLATELEDGLIDRSIPLANSDDVKDFSHIFTTKTAKDFSDQHLWLSLLLKRPHDSFTRVQRLTCCVVVLFTTMLTSAMFFQLNNNTKYLWKIGSLVIDYKGIIIGVQSSFIILPITGTIVELFRQSESFSTYKARKQTKELNGQKAKRSKFLPCGFIVVAWFLSVSAIISSLVVVLFYSMQWGNEKSQQFLLSVFTGFFQSAFVIQPLKLVVVALVLASILKKNKEENDALDMYKYSTNKRTVDQAQHKLLESKLQARPLTKDQLEYARKRRLMEVRLRLFLQDFISYLIFLVFLIFVVRGYRDPDAYNFSKALTDDVIHEHFNNIQDVPGLWSWVQNHFIPAIYSQSWYNGDNFTNHKMLRNQEAFRIGLSRLRQLRVKPGTCQLDEDVIGIVQGCNDFYSLELNEEKDFDVAWKPLGTARKKRSIFDDYDGVMHWKTEDDISEENDMNEEVEMEEDELSSYEDESLESDANFHKKDSVKPGTGTALSKIYGDINNGLVNVSHHGSVDKSNDILKQQLDHKSKILKRLRRALKFKIKRKTIPSSSLKSHSNEIIIDSQYLLPDGSVRPNKQHWKYSQASKLRGFPYFGKFALYSGGGYVASLATDIDYARAVAMALEQDSWIDSLTRAVFFEFSVYNANMNFFATGFIIVEVLPTGTIIPSPSVRVFRLYRYVGAFGKLVMASEIILVLAMLFFIYKECRHLYRIGPIYFKQFWSWVEITISVSLFAALILRGFSWYEADKILTLLSKDPNRFINFQYVVLADDSLLLAVAVICFSSTLKILKLISIFPTVVILKETLSRCAKPLLNYALPFCIMFCSFAMFANLMFWNSDLFNTFLRSIETQLMMLIGGSVYYSLLEANFIFGPIFFLLFAAFETFVFMNVFIAIVDESISESKSNQEAQTREFVEYIEERVVLMLNTFSNTMHSMLSRTNAKIVSRKPKVTFVQEMSTPVNKPLKSSRHDSTSSNVPHKRSIHINQFEIIQEEANLKEKLSLTFDNFHLIIDRLEKHMHDDMEEVEIHDDDFMDLIKALKRKKESNENIKNA